MIGNRTQTLLTSALLIGSLAGTSSASAEQPHRMPAEHQHQPGQAMQRQPPEAFRTPRAYHPVSPPQGWDHRPPDIDHRHFNHNFRAHRAYSIGPYMAPRGWVDRSWYFGDILPEPFFAPEYRLVDYWLFDLETPPVGFEWVRYGHDALLINLASGRVEQTVYGIFG